MTAHRTDSEDDGRMLVQLSAVELRALVLEAVEVALDGKRQSARAASAMLIPAEAARIKRIRLSKLMTALHRGDLKAEARTAGRSCRYRIARADLDSWTPD